MMFRHEHEGETTLRIATWFQDDSRRKLFRATSQMDDGIIKNKPANFVTLFGDDGIFLWLPGVSAFIAVIERVPREFMLHRARGLCSMHWFIHLVCRIIWLLFGRQLCRSKAMLDTEWLETNLPAIAGTRTESSAEAVRRFWMNWTSNAVWYLPMDVSQFPVYKIYYDIRITGRS